VDFVITSGALFSSARQATSYVVPGQAASGFGDVGGVAGPGARSGGRADTTARCCEAPPRVGLRDSRGWRLKRSGVQLATASVAVVSAPPAAAAGASAQAALSLPLGLAQLGNHPPRCVPRFRARGSAARAASDADIDSPGSMGQQISGCWNVVGRHPVLHQEAAAERPAAIQPALFRSAPSSPPAPTGSVTAAGVASSRLRPDRAAAATDAQRGRRLAPFSPWPCLPRGSVQLPSPSSGVYSGTEVEGLRPF